MINEAKRLNAATTALANGNPLGNGLGGVAGGIKISQHLTGLPVFGFAHFLGIKTHFANAVGIVGDRAEDIHAKGIAGKRKHANAAHGHAVGDKNRIGACENQHAGNNSTGDNQGRPDAAFHADGKTLDNIGRMSCIAGADECFNRRMLCAGEIFRAPVSRQSQHNAAQGGFRGPPVQTGDAKVRPPWCVRFDCGEDRIGMQSRGGKAEVKKPRVKKPTVLSTAPSRKPKVMDFIALSTPLCPALTLSARTLQVEIISEQTPMARTRRGNMTPMCPNAAQPRIMAATMVTS